LDEGEFLVFAMSVALGIAGTVANRTGRLHHLYFRDNPAPGIVRLGVLLAMAWIAFVIWRHADPSVTGFYVVFYLVIGYAAVKVFGQSVAAAYGARTRVDAVERRNIPAALFIATFTLATGLIFGGSLWGEADPVGNDEGGWWIPVSFFLLGWTSLVIVFGMFLAREAGRIKRRLQRERSLDDARAAAFFLLACASVLTDAVAGDFWGWRHGLLTFGVLAGMLVVRETFASWTDRRTSQPHTLEPPSRIVETGVYVILAAGAWGLNRVLDQVLLGG
jgi:hypothetical protein